MENRNMKRKMRVYTLALIFFGLLIVLGYIVTYGVIYENLIETTESEDGVRIIDKRPYEPIGFAFAILGLGMMFTGIFWEMFFTKEKTL